jgi:D-inositol-3-phosphate glycosyltransferase
MMHRRFHVAMLSVHTCPLATLGGQKTGGMNVYVRELSRELARRGHYVDVYTARQRLDIPRISKALGYGARVIHLPADPERAYDRHRVHEYLPQFVDGVVAQAEAEGIRYDVLHSHYWLSGAAAHELRRRWGTPTMHMFHTLGKMKNAVARRAEERETAHRIAVAATPIEKVQLIRHYGADPSRVHVISPGVDTELFHPIAPAAAKERIGVCPERSIILFVGRIEPLKGIDNLLRAIAQMVEERPELRERLCVPIIGGDLDGAQEDKEMMRLQALRAELGISELVMFLGARDQDALRDYYSAAELVVMPSDYESFGMVALEAMACGTPVIASDVGGLPFLVRHRETGYRVPARDPAALASRITQLLTDEGLRRRMGQRAVLWAQSHAWPRVADHIEGIYGDLVMSQPLDLAERILACCESLSCEAV